MAANRIYVTERDLADGVKGSAYNCPVAKAVTRATGRGAAVAAYIYIGVDRYSISKAVRRKIYSFDEGLPVGPFSFVLRRDYA